MECACRVVIWLMICATTSLLVWSLIRYAPSVGIPKAASRDSAEPFTDQNRRYYELSNERAVNCWRIVFLLLGFLLGGLLVLTIQPGSLGRANLLRCAVTVLIEAVVLGCCCGIADQSFRHHENLKTNLAVAASKEKGRPDFTAWVWSRYRGRMLMGYYITAFLGIVFFAASLW